MENQFGFNSTSASLNLGHFYCHLVAAYLYCRFSSDHIAHPLKSYRVTDVKISNPSIKAEAVSETGVSSRLVMLTVRDELPTCTYKETIHPDTLDSCPKLD